MLSHPMDCFSCFLPLCPYLVMSCLYSHLCASPVLRLDCCVSTARLNELSSTLMMLLNVLLELSASSCAFLDNSVTEYRTKQNKLSGVFPSFCFPFLSFFIFIMNDPAVLILLLEQGDRSLEDHTNDFVFLANLTHYPDNCLCSFYYAGPHHTRAVVRGWSSRASPSSKRGRWCPASHIWPWTSQPRSGPRAQSSTTPRYGAAWAHRRRRARACRGHWAIAIRSDRADDRPEPQVSDQVRERRWILLWRSQGQWKAPPTAPPLGVSTNWTWEI